MLEVRELSKYIYILLVMLYEFIYIYSVYFLFKNFFCAKRQRGKNVVILGSVVYTLVVLFYRYFSLSEQFSNQIKIHIMSVRIIILVMYLFRTAIFLFSFFEHQKGMIGFSMFYIAFDSIFESTFDLLYNAIVHNGHALYINILTASIGPILVLIILKIYSQINRKKNIVGYLISVTDGEYIILSIILILMYIIEYGVLESEVYPFFKIDLAITVLLIVFVIMYLFIMKAQNLSKTAVLTVMEEQMSTIVEYYEELRVKDEEIRRFRHDTKNLLYILGQLLESKRYEEAGQYIKDMEETLQNATVNYRTGCYIADAIIASKQRRAEEISTVIRTDGPFPSQGLKEVDMVIFLSNILDNAIEACEKVDGMKEILIKSSLKVNAWMLKVSNPVNEKPQIVNNQIMTTKKDKKIHGFGTMNIQRVAEKYGGSVFFRATDKIFEIESYIKIERKVYME